MSKIAALYARVSSSKQKEENTIASQIQALLTYAKEHNFQVPEGWVFQDDGYSGKNLRRPGLDDLRDTVQEYSPDAVLVYRADRLSRNFAHQIILKEDFQKHGIQLIFLDDPKGDLTPTDQMLLQFRGIFAEYERTQIAERCRRGRIHKAKQGHVSVMSRAPFGYTYIKKSANNLARYDVDLEDSKTVEKIFTMYSNELSPIEKICHTLEAEGIKTPTGRECWSSSTIRRILKNPAYKGLACFGRTKVIEAREREQIARKGTKVFKVAYKPYIDCPKEEWIGIPVPAIISEETFNHAQDLLVKNKKRAARNTKEQSILQGLLICGECGLSYYKKKRGGYSYYCCRSHLKRNLKKCKNHPVRQENIDESIWKSIIYMLNDPSLIENEICRRLKEEGDSNDVNLKREEIVRGLNRTKNSRDKLIDAYTNTEALTLDDLKKRIEDLNKKMLNYEKDLESLEAVNLKKEKLEELEYTLEQFKSQLNKNSEKMTVKEKQNIIRLLVDNIVIAKSDIIVNHCIPLGNSLNEHFSPLSAGPQAKGGV